MHVGGIDVAQLGRHQVSKPRGHSVWGQDVRLGPRSGEGPCVGRDGVARPCIRTARTRGGVVVDREGGVVVALGWHPGHARQPTRLREHKRDVWHTAAVATRPARRRGPVQPQSRLGSYPRILALTLLQLVQLQLEAQHLLPHTRRKALHVQERPVAPRELPRAAEEEVQLALRGVRRAPQQLRGTREPCRAALGGTCG